MGWIALLVTSCVGWIALRNTLPCRCLLNQKPISESQLLLAAVPKAAGTKETWKELMETLAWSFTALYDGACPKKDKAGKPMELQKGKRFRKGWLWAITGDLEWYASEFSWPYSASNYICPYCAADQLLEGSTKPFTDMRPSAAWRATVLPPEELKKEVHPPLVCNSWSECFESETGHLTCPGLGGVSLLTWKCAGFHHGQAGRHKQPLGSNVVFRFF